VESALYGDRVYDVAYLTLALVFVPSCFDCSIVGSSVLLPRSSPFGSLSQFLYLVVLTRGGGLV
jgi:hypothetical protein